MSYPSRNHLERRAVRERRRQERAEREEHEDLLRSHPRYSYKLRRAVDAVSRFHSSAEYQARYWGVVERDLEEAMEQAGSAKRPESVGQRAQHRQPSLFE